MAKPVRRGRAPRTVKAEAAPRAAAQQETPVIDTPKPIPVAVRKPRSSVAGGNLKLHAPEREGYVRRWVNDKGNRIAELNELGYSLVEDTGIATHGPGSRINRLAGTHDGGAPLKTFLMETPKHLWEQGMREKEAEREEVDLAINQGRDPSGEVDPAHSYRPGETRHSSITVDRG